MEHLEVVNPAGFWIRLLAGILDSLIVMIPVSILSFALTGGMDGEAFTNIFSLLYHMILPVAWYGYTVGKRMLGIRIVKTSGENVGIGTMLMRVLVASLLYVLTLGIAFIVSVFMVALREDKRSIHDFIAGTYVTYEKPL